MTPVETLAGEISRWVVDTLMRRVKATPREAKEHVVKLIESHERAVRREVIEEMFDTAMFHHRTRSVSDSFKLARAALLAKYAEPASADCEVPK